MGDLIVASAIKVAHARTGTRTRAGRAAVGGEAADARFQVDCNKVRHDECAIELLLTRMQLMRVDDNGKRRRHALIAAAGVDDNRLFAAVHARVRAGSGPRLSAVLHAVAVGVKQDLADGRAVLARQSRLSNGGIVLDLARDGCAHVIKIDFICKCNDVFDRQQLAAFVRLGGLLRKRFAEQNLTVVLDAHDIRVAVDDLDKGRLVPCVGAHLNIERAAQRRLCHRDLHRGKVIVEQRQLLLRNIGQHLKLRVRVADAHTRCDGNRDSLAPARVRDDDAFDIFNDIAADGQFDPLRQSFQCFPCERARVSDGNGLRAAHRGHKLFVQDPDIRLIKCCIHGHFSNLSFRRSFNAAALLPSIVPKIYPNCNALSVFCAQKRRCPVGHLLSECSWTYRP